MVLDDFTQFWNALRDHPQMKSSKTDPSHLPPPLPAPSPPFHLPLSPYLAFLFCTQRHQKGNFVDDVIVTAFMDGP